MEWYVLNVFNGKEKSVKENIEKEIELKNMTKYVEEVLIPTEKYINIKNGKKINSERNYMPGYIMIKCDLNGEVKGTIKNTKGVIKFLSEPMKEKEVNRFLQKNDDLKTTDNVAFEHDLMIGQKIEIVDGPFSSMFGSITKILTDKKIVCVDVNIFNRKTSIELNFEQIIS